MKKLAVLFIIGSCSLLQAVAKKEVYMPFIQGSFPIQVFQPSGWDSVTNRQTDYFRTVFDKVNSADHCEIRISLIKQVDKQVRNLNDQLIIVTDPVIYHIADDKTNIVQTIDLDSAVVDTVNHADRGKLMLIKKGNYSFFGQYDYVLLGLFYKAGYGIVCEAVLFSDTGLLKSGKLNDAFSVFRFYDSSGN